jgi:hypothetical protein
MNKALKKRMSLYYSGLINPIYELYKLKNNPEYIILKYCSFATLTTYGMFPKAQQYQVVRVGALHYNNSIQAELERLIINIKESTLGLLNATVGDVFKVFTDGHVENYFIDSVGLKKLEYFD